MLSRTSKFRRIGTCSINPAVDITITLCITALLLTLSTAAFSQHVGINTDAPARLLSVAGSIAVDHDNTNFGTPDSAALVFGTGPSLAAIFSKKIPGSGSYNGLDFWTNNQQRMIITEGGTVGINVQNPDPNAKLYVGGKIFAYLLESNTANVNSNATIGSTLTVNNRININGSEFNPTYRLTVNGGNSYFGGIVTVGGELNGTALVKGNTIQANQYLGVGISPDPAYRLKVHNGNSRFGGDVQVTGTLDVDDLEAETINGTGVVRSNGSSPLRIGFDDVTFTLNLGAGNQVDLDVDITSFSGGDNDVRVFVSQFDPDPLPQYANWHDFSFHVHSVDPVSDTCKVRLTNNTDGVLSIKGTLYLTSIAKN